MSMRFQSKAMDLFRNRKLLRTRFLVSSMWFFSPGNFQGATLVTFDLAPGTIPATDACTVPTGDLRGPRLSKPKLVV